MVRRVRKAGTDLINKSRKSWHEDSRPSSMLMQGSESGGNESDASADDARQCKFDVNRMHSTVNKLLEVA